MVDYACQYLFCLQQQDGKMARQRLESSGIGVLSVEVRNQNTYINAVIQSNNITALLILIQQNNLFTHLLPYSPFYTKQRMYARRLTIYQGYTCRPQYIISSALYLVFTLSLLQVDCQQVLYMFLTVQIPSKKFLRPCVLWIINNLFGLSFF